MRRFLLSLALAAGLLSTSVAHAQADKVDAIRAEAKRLMVQARELKQAGEPERAEAVASEAKKLMAVADELAGQAPVKKKGEPKAQKAVKPQPQKTPKQPPHKAEPKVEKKIKVPGLPVAVKKPMLEAVPPPRKVAPGHAKGPIGAEQRLEHLMAASHHLRAAGAVDVAENLERHIGEMKRQMMAAKHQQHGSGHEHSGQPGGEIDQLRREVAELRRAIQELRAELQQR